jgi:hypothetical protein
MIRIPVLDANDSLLEIELEGSVFFLRMSWNSEGEFWVLGLEDYARNVILAGVRVVPNSPLLSMFRHLPIPLGEIYAVLLASTREDLLRTDFADDSAELVYVESTDEPL